MVYQRTNGHVRFRLCEVTSDGDVLEVDEDRLITGTTGLGLKRQE